MSYAIASTATNTFNSYFYIEERYYITGTEKPFSVLAAVFIITSILTFGGISAFVVLIVIVPLSKPLFKQLNIAWNLVVIPVNLGIGTFTMAMLPGTPSIQNIVPTTYLRTTLTAAPTIDTNNQLAKVSSN